MFRLTTARQLAGGLVAASALVAILGQVLPSGVPTGVILLGLALGGLDALTAVGLVLIYRAARIINFAQVSIGGLASALAVLLVAGWGAPYPVAVVAGLLVAVATGALVEVVVVRRFWSRSRLIFTVATIGVGLVVSAAQLVLPSLFSDVGPTDTFGSGWSLTLHVGPVVLTADHLIALVVVPTVLGALWLFLDRSRPGTAIRAMADAPDRARLLGIPLRRLSLLTWMVAAGLSGIGAILSTPMIGANIGQAQSGRALFVPLVAAVVGRMEKITVAASAAIAIGVFDQIIFWNYPRSSTVDVVLFVVLLAALMLQRPRRGQRSDQDSEFTVRPPAPLTSIARALPEIRIAKAVGWTALAVVALLLPLGMNNSRLAFSATLAIYGILAISLALLTGWGGLVSLGQFAFAGLGGSACAYVLTEAQLDVLVALPCGMLVGAAAAAVVGVPAIRFRPLFFAVTTFALAVPVASWLLNPTNFPSLTPSSIERPVVAGRWDLDSPLSYYYFCLAALVLVVVAQRNLRRSRVGRAIVATRDNPRVAASMSISPQGALLTAVACSGAMAGLAGGLWVIGLRSVPFNAFSVEASIQLFTMVVIGGLGSTVGVLLGAAYVWSVEFFLRDAAQLLATGAGLLVLLMVLPEGLGGAVFNIRDRLVNWRLRRRGLLDESRPDDAGSARVGASDPEAVDDASEASVATADDAETGRLVVRGLAAGYGHMPVLRSVDLAVAAGQIAALVGPNGSGKTTTLRTVAGLVGAHGGSVWLDGCDMTSRSVTEKVESGLATVFGGEDVFGSLTVADNLRLGNWLGRSDGEERVLDLFPELALRRDSRAGTLSGGERQMLTIAMALLCRPSVLLVDELSLGLAPSRVITLKSVLRELADDGVAVLVVEQSAEVVADIADRIIEMDRGVIVSVTSGAPEGGPARALVAPGVIETVVGSDGAEPSDVVLSLSGVGVRYGGVNALVDVDLRLGSQEVLGVIGPNGAGKTTLLDTCSGFNPVVAGHVHLLRHDVTRRSPAARSVLGLGRVFQQAVMYPTMTVAEVLAVARERFVRSRDPLMAALRLPHVVASEEAVSHDVSVILESSGLQAEAETPFGDLPLGTRRQVQLWAALAHEPSVLLLDEPSAGLSTEDAAELGAFIRQLPRSHGVSILIIEHDVPLISAISDRLLAMDRGRVIAAGRPEEVLADPVVLTSYFGASEPIRGEPSDET